MDRSGRLLSGAPVIGRRPGRLIGVSAASSAGGLYEDNNAPPPSRGSGESPWIRVLSLVIGVALTLGILAATGVLGSSTSETTDVTVAAADTTAITEAAPATTQAPVATQAPIPISCQDYNLGLVDALGPWASTFNIIDCAAFAVFSTEGDSETLNAIADELEGVGGYWLDVVSQIAALGPFPPGSAWFAEELFPEAYAMDSATEAYATALREADSALLQEAIPALEVVRTQLHDIVLPMCP